MTIIEIAPLENGAHRNQTSNAITTPDGWIEVPPALEQEAQNFLPFIVLDIEAGVLIGVSQGIIPPPEPEPAPEPSPSEGLDSGSRAEIAKLQEAFDALVEGLI